MNVPSPWVLPTAILVCILIAVAPAAADQVYKSVDAEGNVTYSQTPPSDSVESRQIRVQDAPSEEERRAADSRADQMAREAARMQQELGVDRDRRAAEVAAAEREVEQAKAALEQARIQTESDWQGKAGGGRRLKPAYFQRVEEAEAKLSEAEKAAAKARRDAH